MMATLSDLSGHSLVADFNEYLTGYPLPEVGAYAFSKTWYAPEMPRPGCVWTHSLLIPFARLGNAQSLHTFVGLFNRPNRDNYSAFEMPQSIKVIDEHLDHFWPSNRNLEKLGDVLRKLYESPERPVLVPLTSPRWAERSFLDIWSQQWPRLRRTFTFCTGAISPRHMDGRWFDLQGIPEKRTEEMIHSNENAVIARLEPKTPTIEVGRWYKLAMTDIFEETSPFRDFLFEFGAEAGGGRRDFVGMTNLYLALNDPIDNPANMVLEALETVFPDSTLGVKFKTRLLDGTIGGYVLGRPDFTLRLLLEASEKLFCLERRKINEVAQRAVDRDSYTVMEMIESVYEKNTNPSPVILAAVADALRPEDLVRSSAFRNALLLLASCRPLLLAHDALRKEPKRDEILLDYLNSSSILKHETSVVLAQWLKEKNFDTLLLGAQSSPTIVIPGVLDILSSPSKGLEHSLPIGELVHLCEVDATEAEEWLGQNMRRLHQEELSLEVVACVVVAIEIDSIPIKNNNVEDWEYLLSNHDDLDYVLAKAVYVKLFCHAMKLRGRSGARIATAAFPHLYRLLMDGKFAYAEWYALQEESMGFRWDWNQCRRLAEGLIDQFKAHKWPKKYFSGMLAKHSDLAMDLMEMEFFRAKYRKFITDCLK